MPPSPAPRSPSPSSYLADFLREGDHIGELLPLPLHTAHAEETLHRASIANSPSFQSGSKDDPAPTFEVVRKLGTGSYAVVYLVREILSAPVNGYGQGMDDGMFDFEEGGSNGSANPTANGGMVYGREFALKCLSKANLDDDPLAAQLLEATLHQSLSPHPNIVSLYRTLESPSFLLLLLEYVPGQDLFYFLESARDSLRPSTPGSPGSLALDGLSRTPTTPSLLSALNPITLLSYTRLRLIASMFGQMCDAVASCHKQGVFHRDIKPENFIVTEGGSGVGHDRKVVVKLTDFGLATTEEESSDMDCGSAPYMSFECRNNLAPTYNPRYADVWSLGIVLINMLYHHNPWTDTSLSQETMCPSFAYFRKLATEKNGDARPEDFFTQRFAGLNENVAKFLARRVFTFLDLDLSPGETPRVSAEEFGQWARSLPELFGKNSSSISDSTTIRPLETPPKSRKPSMRGTGAPSTPGRRLLNLMSLKNRDGEVEDAVEEVDVFNPPRPDPEIDLDVRGRGREVYVDGEDDRDGSESRAASTTSRRRKRGARKGKGASTTSLPQLLPQQQFAIPIDDDDLVHTNGNANGVGGDHLDDMAVRSQLLARELSKASTWVTASQASLPLASPEMEPEVEKEVKEKRSKWRMFRMQSSESLATSVSASDSKSDIPPVPAVPPNFALSGTHPGLMSYPYAHRPHPPASIRSAGSGSIDRERSASRARSTTSGSSGGRGGATAANVSSLVMGLSPPVPPMPNGSTSRVALSTHSSSSAASMHSSFDERGRARKPQPPNHWGPAPRLEFVPPKKKDLLRSESPAGPSSKNWRNSMALSTASTSTTTTGTSTYTRYSASNASARSMDSMGTSVSGTSSNWRSGNDSVNSGKGKDVVTPPLRSPTSPPSTPTSPTSPTGMPRNIKLMNGVPWELNQLPRQMHPRPEGDIFGSPPSVMRGNKYPGRGNNSRQGLDTIKERPLATSPLSQSTSLAPPPPPVKLGSRKDAATSTTDLTEPVSPTGVDGEEGPKKVPKGQINALAKMLSALRR